MDLLGQILWYSIFITPIITIPIIWRISKLNKVLRLLLGILIAGILSLIFYVISLSIIFRDGMGPM
jgi:hypothetical protein